MNQPEGRVLKILDYRPKNWKLRNAWTYLIRTGKLLLEEDLRGVSTS
jgi:hypothetical protein